MSQDLGGHLDSTQRASTLAGLMVIVLWMSLRSLTFFVLRLLLLLCMALGPFWSLRVDLPNSGVLLWQFWSRRMSLADMLEGPTGGHPGVHVLWSSFPYAVSVLGLSAWGGW